MQQMTLEQLRATNSAGGVLSATLKAVGASFELRIETHRGWATLVKTRDKENTRRFLDPRKALLLLRDLGISEAHVDSIDWRPEDQEYERRQRPDRAEAMKAAHEALSHSDWLREKLAKSAADPRPRVPHKEIMSEARERINQKLKGHAKAAKN